jgi:CarD family transcriptional regulator
MFDIGDYVVCPGHGVGQVSEVEKNSNLVTGKTFYHIRLIANGMKYMVPVDNKNGVRELVGNEEIGKVFLLLKNHDVILDTSTWNRRYREYMEKVKTGSLLEIADVLRSLLLLKNNKTLSDGERKMLRQCKELLVKEIAISQGNDEDQVSIDIDACFNH